MASILTPPAVPDRHDTCRLADGSIDVARLLDEIRLEVLWVDGMLHVGNRAIGPLGKKVTLPLRQIFTSPRAPGCPGWVGATAQKWAAFPGEPTGPDVLVAVLARLSRHGQIWPSDVAAAVLQRVGTSARVLPVSSGRFVDVGSGTHAMTAAIVPENLADWMWSWVEFIETQRPGPDDDPAVLDTALGLWTPDEDHPLASLETCLEVARSLELPAPTPTASSANALPAT